MSEIDDMRDEMRRLKERIAALERQQALRVVSPPPDTPDTQYHRGVPKDPRACSVCGCIGMHACMGPPWMRQRKWRLGA